MGVVRSPPRRVATQTFPAKLPGFLVGQIIGTICPIVLVWMFPARVRLVGSVVASVVVVGSVVLSALSFDDDLFVKIRNNLIHEI